ncbi:hypothetical protein [Mesorhizobium sp.]|uniref:hypothetical protein n=1 Tax=Mesorhizobium sp. TaxID=1871066 RepID=UPI0025F4A0C8|nr:hypothetical protein [Mesorhizobium sp.]
MNIPGQQPKREHHFYVSTAKFLFHHPEHGIVAVRDPIRLGDAEQHALSPLIIYGLTVAGLPIRWLTFSAVNQRIPFCEVLQTAWKTAEGLRGLPDILRVNRHLAQADPALVADMARVGIQLKIADAKDKWLPASLRSAQDAARWLLRRHGPGTPSLTEAIYALCLDAREDHEHSSRRGSRGSSNRDLEDRIEQWLSLPMRPSASIPVEGTDWKAGPWLSSWESSLPPDRPRYFRHDSLDNGTWLLSGSAPAEDCGEDDLAPIEYGYDNAAEVAKSLIGCWPNPPKEIAAAADTTLRQLQWFISEQTTLDRSTRFRLEGLLGIEYDEAQGSYTPAGPYVLIAQKPHALEDICQKISGGGDACPCEIVPAQGSADPSWRYVLINAYGSPPSIVMAPRGAPITDRLPDLILNYEGVRPVSLPLYKDVVSTCARACQTPEANVREMKDFARRYEQKWADCVWLPD